MDLHDFKKIIVLCGPTAAGKSRISLELAKRFSGEIINADSGQVWRGLDIGTAKPSFELRSKIPHHLFDVLEPDGHFDAACFIEMADKVIEDIHGRGKKVFVVGGTGMYLNVLVRGLCDAPPRDLELRKDLEAEIEKSGLELLHKRLAEVDFESACLIHPNDKTRIIRALEIFELTGIPASKIHGQHKFSEKRYDALKIGINSEREELYKKINDRVDEMLANGWLEEVKGLLSKYAPDIQSFSAIGYRELAKYLGGLIPFEEAVDLIKQNTRRFAKRQLTWFRADREIKWFNPTQISLLVDEVGKFLGNN